MNKFCDKSKGVLMFTNNNFPVINVLLHKRDNQ